MIYVSTGHEKGIGLEVFFKAFLFYQQNLKDIAIVGYKSSIKSSLQSIKATELNESIFEYIEEKENQTIDSLMHILNKIKENDVLITLPSSKDQFIFNNKTYSGHTEFFRKYYKTNLAMCFHRKSTNCLLLTDHIPLKNVSGAITQNLIEEKVTLVLKDPVFKDINHVYFSGINPHAGEDGLLGTEEAVITSAVKVLTKRFKQVEFKGPISGDALHQKENINALLVYAHHDQALSFFKSKHGYFGLNITLGLPFFRLSPDFGTGFDIRGKDIAHYGGMIELLETARDIHDN